ncbi:MAG TPA: molybdopterin-dependent oxidoreductase, partial [Rubrivivax sp.]|nr:molybdopterin-dependent oxidoreductase [Rubrivivax sp.]
MNQPIEAAEAFLRTPTEPAPFADHRALRARRYDLAAEARREADGARVGIGRAHESAHLHVSGEAAYIDDLPELDGTLHVALGLSPLAHGRITGIDLATLRALPGVLAVLTAADIPGVNDCGPIQHDDPILAELAFDAAGRAAGTVHYLGQPVFAVVATERELARRAAARARDVLAIEPLPAILSAREAHAQGRYVVPPMHLARGDAPAAIAAAPHRLAGSLAVGGQEQFYLEGQISYAVPLEDDGMRVHCSTQHPSEMQHAVARALGVNAHHVLVECRRMGGGFGGKESQ